MTNLITIPFYEEQLVAIDEGDGAPFVPVAQFCQRLGLAVEPQIRKLKARESFWGPTIMVAPSGSGLQETVCIPANRVAAWLLSINPGKIKAELRAALERFQNEAADVLYQHFFATAQERRAKIDAEVALKAKAMAWDIIAESGDLIETQVDARMWRRKVEADRERIRRQMQREGRIDMTAENVAWLKDLYARGVSAEELARISGRTEDILREIYLIISPKAGGNG